MLNILGKLRFTTGLLVALLISLLISCLQTSALSAQSVTPSVTPQGFDTRATAAYVIDQTTGTVLLEKRADVSLPPASMSKLMTLFMTFEALRDGRLRWDEKLPVSEHAMAYTGSTMFLDTTDRVSVADLVRGVIVLSGNDACAVLAEALSIDGTEAGFANMMTLRARQLGMTQSTFANSNGWPHPNQRMSMRDLAILADHLIRDFPNYYPLFAEQTFEFDGRAPSNTQNRNPLLSLDIGADGLKTGHTQEAGYGLVGSAKQGDRRVIFVITGLDSARARAEESERIVNWAFRNFTAQNIAKQGDIIGHANVWMGNAGQVDLSAGDNIAALIPILGEGEITAAIHYQGPLQAPIKQGHHVADLVISTPNMPDTHHPLMAAKDVSVGGFFSRVSTAAKVFYYMVAGRPDAGRPDVVNAG